MSPDLGRLALAVALTLSLLQMALAFRAADAGAMFASARRAAYAAFASAAVAFAVLIAAFVGSDFSVVNVAANSHTAKPLLYRVAAAWGSHEGSMALWCLVMSGYGAAFAATSARLGVLGARALCVMGALCATFFAFTLFWSSPFERILPAPLQGNGFNPLLQDPALAIHPPMLYAGYVGLSVSFAIAVAALWTGAAASTGWARILRNWTLTAFSFLTVGIALGSYWAYYELGWGGWWFWDPVENASFMPWLAAAALLHSALATERSGALTGWTCLLAILAFGLSILGTFLTRSGIVTSVHSFAVDPERGLALLAILGATMGAALSLFAARVERLGGRNAFEPVSREAAILANNLFLATVTGVVLIGTLWPLATELLTEERVSVGEPYFELAAVPILGAALAFSPLGPLLAWRRDDARAALRRLWPAALFALMAGLAFVVLLSGAGIGPALAAALGVWAILGAGTDVLRKASRASSGLAAGLRGLFANPRSLAAPLAHAGVGLFALAAGVEAALHTERQTVLAVGDTSTLGGAQVTLAAMHRADGPNYAADRAEIIVEREDGARVVFTPERRLYLANNQSTTEVDIRSSLIGDRYAALGPPQAGEDGVPRWPVRLLFNPMIWALYLGVAMIALGGVLARRRAPAGGVS